MSFYGVCLFTFSIKRFCVWLTNSAFFCRVLSSGRDGGQFFCHTHLIVYLTDNRFLECGLQTLSFLTSSFLPPSFHSVWFCRTTMGKDSKKTNKKLSSKGKDKKAAVAATNAHVANMRPLLCTRYLPFSSPTRLPHVDAIFEFYDVDAKEFCVPPVFVDGNVYMEMHSMLDEKGPRITFMFKDGYPSPRGQVVLLRGQNGIFTRSGRDDGEGVYNSMVVPESVKSDLGAFCFGSGGCVVGRGGDRDCRDDLEYAWDFEIRRRVLIRFFQTYRRTTALTEMLWQRVGGVGGMPGKRPEMLSGVVGYGDSGGSGDSCDFDGSCDSCDSGGSGKSGDFERCHGMGDMDGVSFAGVKISDDEWETLHDFFDGLLWPGLGYAFDGTRIFRYHGILMSFKGWTPAHDVPDFRFLEPDRVYIPCSIWDACKRADRAGLDFPRSRSLTVVLTRGVEWSGGGFSEALGDAAAFCDAQGHFPKSGKCMVCGGAAALRCRRCRIALFCSDECMRKGWKSSHKGRECNQMRAVREVWKEMECDAKKRAGVGMSVCGGGDGSGAGDCIAYIDEVD